MLHINILVRLWQTQRSVDSEVDAALDPDQGEVHHAGVPALVGVHHHPVHLVLLRAAGLPAGPVLVDRSCSPTTTRIHCAGTI